MCQLGGSNPELLARAAKIVERYGYDEININCGALAAGQGVLAWWLDCPLAWA